MCYNFALFIYLYSYIFYKAVEYAIITVKTWLVSEDLLKYTSFGNIGLKLIIDI